MEDHADREPEPMITVSARLTQEEYRAIKRVAREEDVTLSELMRRSLRATVKQSAQ